MEIQRGFKQSKSVNNQAKKKIYFKTASTNAKAGTQASTLTEVQGPVHHCHLSYLYFSGVQTQF